MVRSFSPAFRFSKKSEADDAIRNVNGYTIPGKFAFLGLFWASVLLRLAYEMILKLLGMQAVFRMWIRLILS
jgi:hypothetical protein